MSKLIVEVCNIDSVSTHPNADALELASVKGWQCVTQKGMRKQGDKIVYIPIDSMIPFDLSEKMGITKYLSGFTQPDEYGVKRGRVRCAKLRGEPSFGVIMECADANWEIGRDVAEYYGITKHIPEMKLSAGDAETPHPLLQKYTEIENLRNFPRVFLPFEPVVATEKVHGTNCKIGKIEGEWMASSMDVRRKRPADEQMASNIYWHPYTIRGVRELVEHLAQDHRQVILYGEVYGKVQSLNYGKPGALGFAAFDILVDGVYYDFMNFEAACNRFSVPIVPPLELFAFDIEKVKQLSGGNTLFAGANHIREGVVVRPLKERTDPKVGRVIMKYIGDQYLLKRDDGKVTDSADV